MSHGHAEHAHHDHAGHVHEHHLPKSARALTLALAVTGAFMLIEAAGGWYAHSLALLADAGHMVTDVLSLALALAAMRASGWSADARRTYGYQRYQVLAAFVNGLLLLAISAGILFEAILRLAQPEPVAGTVMLGIALIGLVVNVLAFGFLHGAEESINMRAALAHVLGDLLGSVAALIAGAIILLTGWTVADPLLSALVALLLLRMGYRLMRQAGHVLLEGSPEDLDLSGLEQELVKAVPGLASVHHVHAWSIAPEQPVMTLHAVVREPASSDDAIAGISAFLKSHHGVTHVTIQVERVGCEEPCR
jgi:cobalt-zinc-cadmium efflux system protein